MGLGDGATAGDGHTGHHETYFITHTLSCVFTAAPSSSNVILALLSCGLQSGAARPLEGQADSVKCIAPQAHAFRVHKETHAASI